MRQEFTNVEALTSTDNAEVSEGTSTRLPRADAIKNRRRIIEAAEEVFATEGVLAQVDLVAERAGVGVGTVYRNFPTKEILIEEIVRTRMQDLSDATTNFANSDDPGQAFFLFIQEFARHASAKRDLFEALGDAGIDFKTRCADAFDEMRRGIDELLRRAQAAGVVRTDIGTDDVIGLVVGTCHATSHYSTDDGHFQQLISIISDGLRARH